MRLPITEEFLLHLYDAAEKTQKFYGEISPPRSMWEVLHPDLIKFQKAYQRKRAKTEFRHFLNNLQRRGYIKLSPQKDGTGVLVTEKGAEKALRVKRRYEAAEKRSRKDGKWQMIIFDIPEKKRFLRDAFRAFLIAKEYQRIQQSVWACPYDVAEETELFMREHRLKPFVKVFLLEEIFV